MTAALRSAIEDYLRVLSAGGHDLPRRKVAADLRTILAAAPDTAPAAPQPVKDLPTAADEYAVLSFRDGLEPVDSLEEADEQMRMFWKKPGRARIMHRRVAATDWSPLDADAKGPLIQAA